MLFSQLIDLLSNSDTQSVHPIVPLDCEFLELFAVVKLNLIRLVFVFLDQTSFDALLGMFSHNLDVLKLRICIPI